MTLFALVKEALDVMHSQAESVYGANADAEIAKRMNDLRASYVMLTTPDRRPIDYSDPATRFAYTYKYVASHSDYLVQVLERLRDEKGSPIFEPGHTRVTCVGAGPGSDLVGLLKYLNDRPDEDFRRLTCYLLDREQAWADTWTEIGSSLPVTGNVHVNYLKLDITTPEAWKTHKNFLNADLFTMVYFVSEVCALDDPTVGEFFDGLFDGAVPNASFVYIDNASHAFDDYFDRRWKARGDIEALYEDTNVTLTPHRDEQVSDLGEYPARFGHSPKLQGRLSIRILQKK